MAQTQFDRKLKRILQKGNYLEEAKLEEAMERASQEEKSFNEVLVERNYLDEKTLIAAVAIEMKIPPIDIARLSYNEQILECIPQDLANYYKVIPVSKLGNTLTVAVSNPFDILKLDDLKIATGLDIRPVISTEMAIKTAIGKVYDKSAQKLEEFMETLSDDGLDMELTGDDADEDLDLSEVSGDEKSPVIRFVNMMVFQAIKDGVSDIHIEPFEKKIRIRYRTDGMLKEANAPPKKMHNAIVARIKVMSALDISERRIPQDGKFQLRVEGRQVDFRVSILPMIHGEKVVLRILDSSSLALSLDTLGFEDKCLRDIRDAVKTPYGMLLITGPTGSGKTTTLYSSLKEILSVQDNVITVEDPVEYQLDGVNQVPINEKRGLTFAAALRSILRQDPDKIMIGELRDLETIEIAVKAALTGHLVLSTLHTNSAAATITRMIDMGVDPFLVASTVLLVAAQRLGRRLCGECKQEYEPDQAVIKDLQITDEDMESGPTFFKPVGCSRCAYGYKGRFAILETLPMTEGVKRMIIQGMTEMDIHQKGEEEGMLSLRRICLLNALRGVTSLEEVVRVTVGGH